RTLVIWASLSESRLRPPSRISPPTTWPPLGSSCMIDIAVMVLPQPDSPTMPRVSPTSTENVTPSSACTVDRLSRISVRRSFTSTRGIGSPLLEPGLAGVAQGVADDVEGHDEQHDHQGGRVEHPPVPLGHVVRAGVHQSAEVRLGRRQAETEEAQGGQG